MPVAPPPTRSPKRSLEDRQSASVDHSKCLCRIWKGGLDNVQCSSRAVDNGCCKVHAKKISEHGPWWLGKITDPRTEEPYGPPNVKIPGHHYWSDQPKPPKRMKDPNTRYENLLPRPVQENTCFHHY